MDHLTSVSDIPLPGEDINTGNEINHQHNPAFSKSIENVTYTENLPDYSASNIPFDENAMIIEQQLETEPVIDEDKSRLIDTIRRIQNTVKIEPEREQLLAETVEDLQKFVEQTTQEAVVTVNDNAIQSVEIVEETTEMIPGVDEIATDHATIVTEPCEITETAEVRTETIVSPAEINVSLDEMMCVPVHDNSVEIKDEDISSNNVSMNSIEMENSTLDEEETEIRLHVTPEVPEENQNDPEMVELLAPEYEANPMKRSGRINSAVEAIKNDWNESEVLTVEEVKDENPESSSTACSISIVDEPELETTVEEIQHVQESDDSITEVIVLQSVNDGLELKLDQNVTIEIIDETKTKQPEEKDKAEEAKTDETIKTNNTKRAPPVVIIPDKKSLSEKGDAKQGKKKLEIVKPGSKNPVIGQRTVTIPCHVLGRNVDNPTEDLISNGRAPPKPRLGVKVPYRFLTSQIVSKQEIAKELLEIHAKRNPPRDPPVGGDIFFAKKLTQRLATKISESEKAKKERSEQSNSSVSGIPSGALLTPPNSQASDKSTVQGSSKSINDNSDLLAILEGDVDVDLTKEIKNTKAPSGSTTDTDNQIEKALENISKTAAAAGNMKKRKMDPELEREIALKQLESLPREYRTSVRKYARRGRPCKYYEPSARDEPVKKYIKTSTTKPNVRGTITPTKPVEVKAKPVPKSALELVQSKDREISDNVKQAAENIVENIRKKKIKDISLRGEDLSDDLLDTSLTPKKVSKTYSRKDTVVNVNVPADLEQIVNDQSALESEENIQDESAEKLKENDDKKQIKSPAPVQKKPKRSIGDDINTPEVTLVSKRARVIKPKIIWDPAESELKKPKPQVVADLTKPKRGRPRKSNEVAKPEETPKKPETETTEAEVVDKGEKDTDKTEEKIVEDVEEEEDEEEDDEEVEIEKDPEYKPPQKIEEKPIKMLKRKGKILSRATLSKVQAKKKMLIKRKIRSLAGKLIRSTNGDLKSSLALSKKKKQLVQKLANEVKSANKPKRTELDRLLMDEGAVNMLYSVRQDDKVIGKRNASKLIPSKDLVNRTMALRKVITQSSINEDTPTKALRKKENALLSPIKITSKERKKSRDSIRSSIQSPPPSPSYASNRAEASRIIRRHSSSFSSDCSSPRRLSIDLQHVQENAEKQEEQKSDETKKETDFSSPARSLRRKGGVPIYERKSDEKTYKGKKKLLPETETSKDSDSNKDEKESTDRLTPTTDKSDKSDKHDKLSAAEKRKLNNEMSKNFSKSPVPKKRTRNSKPEDDVDQVKEETGGKTAGQSAKTNKTTEEVEEKPKRTRHISLTSNYEEISLRKIDNLVQIILTPSNTKLKNSVSIKMFKELNEALTNLAKDDTCRVVLLTSTDSSFCHGVDFSVLIQSNAEKRTSVAQEMAANLKNFLRSLAHFPKPIIAGVQGSAVGLGVTMLPLFDLVFASDKATFSTPYGRLGQVPEGIAFLTLPNLLGSTLTSELMFANRKLTASEAVHHGLVTRTIWPDKFQEDVLSNAMTISSQSGQSMQATKSLLRQSLLSKLDDALESENKLLVSHWTSAECQQNFKKLLHEEEWW